MERIKKQENGRGEISFKKPGIGEGYGGVYGLQGDEAFNEVGNGGEGVA